MTLGIHKAEFKPNEIDFIEEQLSLDLQAIDDLSNAIPNEQIDGIIRPLKHLEFQSEADHIVIAALLERMDIHPTNWREAIPKTSEGIFAIVCERSNYEARTQALEYHDPQTMYCSNVERAVQRKSTLEQIYCFRDAANRYNLGISLMANKEEKKLFYAQSTFVGMVEQALKEIEL